VAVDGGALSAREDLGALLPPDVEIGQDLFELLAGGLRADHGVRVERVALDDRLDAFERAFDEPIVDGFLNQGARRTRADFAWLRANIVKPSSALSKKSSSLSRRRQKRYRRLAAESNVTGIKFCEAYCMISRPSSSRR